MKTNTLRESFVPVVVVLCAIVLLWYVATVFLNMAWQRDVYERADNTDYTVVELVSA